MLSKHYKLRYLSLFEHDLIEAANYIANVLKNPDAAYRLIDKVETAILERVKNPTSFEPYRSMKPRRDTYYRIYVGNYTVYYVVIEDVMEVRRLAYTGRNIERIL